MDEKKDNLKKDISVRLRRIEGQVKGIERMMDNEACCKDVLVQIAAVRAAINKVGGLILENYAVNCMSLDEENPEIKKLIDTMIMFLK